VSRVINFIVSPFCINDTIIVSFVKQKMKSEVMRQSTGAGVIPAKAGIQMCRRGWMPAPYRSTGQAYAGMTESPLPFTDRLRSKLFFLKIILIPFFRYRSQ
jgi:hypothetical protein